MTYVKHVFKIKPNVKPNVNVKGRILFVKEYILKLQLGQIQQKENIAEHKLLRPDVFTTLQTDRIHTLE